MMISTDKNIVTSIERFEVPAAEADEAVQHAVGAIRSLVVSEADFVAALVLCSIKGNGVATYVQWRKLSTAAPSETPSKRHSLRDALGRLRLLDSRNYELAFIRQPAAAASTHVSFAGTPFIHFGIFGVTPDNQRLLLERAEAEAPNSFGTPGLLAINFHRSLDGAQVVNLGAWSSFESFEALHSQPSFKAGAQYFRGIADFRPDFFALRAVI